MNDLRKIKRQNLLIYITGYIAVTVLGTLLHFVYGWSSSNMLVGLFAAVNESTWEHMKLAFYPIAHIFRNIHGDLLQTALPQGNSSCRMYSSKSGRVYATCHLAYSGNVLHIFRDIRL